VLIRFPAGQAGRLVEAEIVAVCGLLDDGPDQRSDPAEDSPAEHDIDQNDLAGGVLKITVGGSDPRPPGFAAGYFKRREVLSFVSRSITATDMSVCDASLQE